MEQDLEDHYWMARALELATLGGQSGEVPIAALLVEPRERRVVAYAHNKVEQQHDASAHAELLVLRAGADALGGWRLTGLTLYCTLEPCIMCYGAMVHFRIGRLVWGAPDLRHGALGSLFDLSLRAHPIHTISTRGGVLKECCASKMREFFARVRQQAGKV